MARIFGAPGKEKAPPAISAQSPLQKQQLVASEINLGMITMLEPTNIPVGAMQFVKNALVRYDKTVRRPGSTSLAPAKPDSNSVLRVGFIKKKDGTAYTVRLTRSTANLLEASWDPLVITPALTGTDTDYIDVCNVLDNFIYSNNGADPLQLINFTAETIAPLTSFASNYRTVCGFFNRAVGFALRGTDETRVGWSKDGDPTVWDPATDSSAGFSSLVDSPDDFSDFITHGFSFSNVMIILREKSIWLATKQPIATNPFYFYAAVPGIGCDCPYSAQIVKNGVAWVDTRTQTIHAYSPGSTPEQIGRPIEKTLLANINDPTTVFSTYDPVNDEYSVFIPPVGSGIVPTWTYNFKNKAWSYGEYFGITSVDDVSLATGVTRIEDLVGTIEGLTGTIENLSPGATQLNVRTFGRSDGTIGIEDNFADVDAPQTGFNSGVSYDTQLVSKVFVLPELNLYLAEINIEYFAVRVGSLKLEYSTDGGVTESSWKVAKNVTALIGTPSLLVFRKMVKCRRLAWRITTQAGAFEALTYEVHIYSSGQSQDGE